MKLIALSLLSFLPQSSMCLPAHKNKKIANEMTSMLLAGGSAGAINTAVVMPLAEKIPNKVVRGAVGAGVASVLFLGILDAFNYISEKIQEHKNRNSTAASVAAVNPTTVVSANPMGSPTGCCPGCGVNAAAAAACSSKPAEKNAEESETFLKNNDVAQLDNADIINPTPVLVPNAGSSEKNAESLPNSDAVSPPGNPDIVNPVVPASVPNAESSVESSSISPAVSQPGNPNPVNSASAPAPKLSMTFANLPKSCTGSCCDVFCLPATTIPTRRSFRFSRVNAATGDSGVNAATSDSSANAAAAAEAESAVSGMRLP